MNPSPVEPEEENRMGELEPSARASESKSPPLGSTGSTVGPSPVGGSNRPIQTEKSKVRFRVAFRHLPVPYDMPDDKRVSDGAFRLYARIMRSANWETMECKTSQADLASRIGGTDRTVRTYLRELATAGYVLAEYDRERHATSYTLLAGAPEADFRDHRKFDDSGHRKHEASREVQELDLVPDSRPQPDKDSVAPATANGKKLDTVRANEFIQGFLRWYAATYKRPHPEPISFQQVCMVSHVLKGLDRFREKNGLFPGATTEKMVWAALEIAAQSPYEVWFLKRGDALMLPELLRFWQKLVDKLLQRRQTLLGLARG